MVTTPDALRRLEGGCATITHCAKRSRDVAALHTKYVGQVSRRDLDAKVHEARKHRNAEYRRGLKRLQWFGAGIVWAMDDTEYGFDGAKCWVHNVRDLGAQYVMEPMVSKSTATGVEVAKNLERLFRAHGAPLILKRDGGSNLCSREVDEVLAKWSVLPLTSPPYYPRYNGAVEWSQGQLKKEMEQIMNDVSGDIGNVLLHARLASHAINHRSSPTLQGRNPCHTVAISQSKFTLNERRQLLRWVETEQEIILRSMDPKPDRRAAWRQAVTRWLTNNGLLIIREAR
jgi:transposase InsO family protein